MHSQTHQRRPHITTVWHGLTALDRISANYLINEGGCWEWQGALNWGGYGHVSIDGRRTTVHRVAYMLLVGPIPDGLDIDHLCRNRRCINPDHLEPVTRSENLKRGIGRTGWADDIENCPKGHPYDNENTYHDPRGWRGCKTCRADATRKARKATA